MGSLCGESARRNTIRNNASWIDSFRVSTVLCVVVVFVFGGGGGGGGDDDDDDDDVDVAGTS